MADILARPISIALMSALALYSYSGTALAGDPPSAVSPSLSRDAEPAWAAAAGPGYTSNVLHAGNAVPGHVYQIDTADDYETVAAWYKSHVKAVWSNDSDSKIVANVGDVEISVEKNNYWHNASQPKTMIGFFRKG